jgi:hypothetical protein
MWQWRHPDHQKGLVTILARHGDTTARVRAAPLLFGPVVVVLVLALVWRLRADLHARSS